MTKKPKASTPKTTATTEAMSTNDQLDLVRGAFRQTFNPENGGLASGEYCYPEDIFLSDGYLICEQGGVFYRVDFTKKDGAYTFTAKADWKKMEQTYTPTGESRRTGYFAEPVDLREAEVDAANYVIKGATLIKPGFSTNVDRAGRPRYYSKTTLQASAAVFEGARMFFNHPRRSDEKDLPERDVLDIAGYYKNVRASDDGRLLTDIHMVQRKTVIEEAWPLIVEAINNKPDLVELSINALGQTRIGEAEGRQAVIVESIVAANSVDLVTTGAAGGTFAGALLASDGDALTHDLLDALTFDEWRAARPDFVKRLKSEWGTVRETEEVKTLRTRLEEKQTEVTRLSEANRTEQAELEKFRRAETADRLLRESRLPNQLRTAVRTELLEATDETEMKAILEREQAKYKVAPKPSVPVTGAGQRVSGGQPAGETKPEPNPSAKLLGLNESTMAKPGESVEAYRQRRLKEAQAT